MRYILATIGCGMLTVGMLGACTTSSSTGGALPKTTVIRPTEPANGTVQTRAVGAFYGASWDYQGFYDQSGVFEHQYGGKAHGFYTYRFTAPDATLQAVEVSARLSAESHAKGKKHETSDVTLLLNGVAVATKTVRPDDQRGRVYRWQVTDSALLNRVMQADQEHLNVTFKVAKDAKNARGLVLYGEALNPLSDKGQPVTVTFKYRQPGVS
jgi:sulfur relay (sulfurtransferase) complex TusBCD TusD component (DsrE family)